MKYLFLLTALFSAGNLSAQDAKTTEKFSKNIVKAIKSDKGFKKIIIPHKKMNEFMEVMLENYIASVKELGEEDEEMASMLESIRESLKDVQSDSSYKVLSNKMKNEIRDIRQHLTDQDINPKTVKYVNSSHSIWEEDDDLNGYVSGDFDITFTGNDGQDTLRLKSNKCLFYEGKWYLGNQSELRDFYGQDVSLICACIQDETIEGCDELKSQLEEDVKTMSDEDMEKLMKEITECMKDANDDYKEEEIEGETEKGVGETMDEEVFEEHTEEAAVEDYEFSEDEVMEAQLNMEEQIENYCACGIYLFSETLPEGCEDQINEIQDLLNSLNPREQALYMHVIDLCND